MNHVRAPKLWPVCKPGRTLSVSSMDICQRRYLNLAYELHKPPADLAPTQTPIVFMHGLFGSRQNNRSISKAIARDLKTSVYAVDLRNHGDSPHDPRHDYIAMADDIEEFMDKHKIEKPGLIGHSMGAKVAMTVALQSPTRVSSLVPVDNAPADAVLKGNFAKYTQGMRKIMETQVTKAVEADHILQDFEESLPIRQFLLTNLVRSPGAKHMHFRIPIQILATALGNMGDFPFKDPDQARYDGPTLFVRGVKSDYVPDEVLPLIGRFFPRFEVCDVDSNHWVISEQPEQFRRGVSRLFPTIDELRPNSACSSGRVPPR
ncbi:hypothetical protein MMC15_006382 [Xylographa vitiligo]|nr:hypothetical protein [Xylographa vitiligo]